MDFAGEARDALEVTVEGGAAARISLSATGVGQTVTCETPDAAGGELDMGRQLVGARALATLRLRAADADRLPASRVLLIVCMAPLGERSAWRWASALLRAPPLHEVCCCRAGAQSSHV